MVPALPTFRYGNVILPEAIIMVKELSEESALCANRHMNKVIRNEIKIRVMSRRINGR
jgi:hypothetical protein